MRCVHPQTDNPWQFSADNRVVLEDPARDAHELRIIKLARWPDAFYARFLVGPDLDQPHPCSFESLSALDKIDNDGLSLVESADVRSVKRGDWTNTSLPPLSRAMKPYRECNIKTTF